ncbi:hypothetical protein [Saccharopolyspora sp. NPDC002376]
MNTGMEGLAAGASALAGQAQGLRAAVDSGKVVMTPEAAEAVAKVYLDKAEKLGELRLDTDRLIAKGAYGKCFIGNQMDQKFEQKVNDPKTGLVAILDQMEKILRNMAQAFKDSARDMANTDDEHASNLNRNV